MTNKRLDSLRSEVRKRRVAVTNKENRIKRTTGVDVRGTAADPRRDTKVVDRYTQRQLNSYLLELNAFMDRGNGFVAGVGNEPISKAAWTAYKKIETKYNSIGGKHLDGIGDILIKLDTETGLTVAERNLKMVPNSQYAAGEIVHRPYSPLDRKSTRVKDEASLLKLTAALEKKIQKDYLPNQIAKGREQLTAMLATMGESATLIAKANKLNDYQFNVLWNYTGFATSVSAVAESDKYKKRNAERSKDKINAGVLEGYSNDIGKFFDWAKNISEEDTKRAKKSSVSKARSGKKKTFNRS